MTAGIGAAIRLLSSAAAGLAVGIATSYLQGSLSGAANLLANSGAIWSLVAFAMAFGLGSSRPVAVGAGLLALAGEVAGYYAVAAPLRDIATSSSERLLWTVAALVLGPLVGLAADRCRRGTAAQRAIAAVCICGIVIGEGIHRLARISKTDPAGWLALIVGAAAALAVLALVRIPPRERAAAGVALAVVAGLTFVAYGQTVLN